MKDKKMKADKSGRDCVMYTADDFGVISTDDELRAFLNAELAKDSSRQPIPEQS